MEFQSRKWSHEAHESVFSPPYIFRHRRHFQTQTSLFLTTTNTHLPDSVRGWRGNVDGQCSLQLLQFHGEEQRGVGHLLHLLLDELRLCGLLEVLGLGDLVHEAHDLAGLVATHKSVFNKVNILV